MAGVASAKLQKTRTAEDLKTDSEFDANDGQAQAKSQSTKTVVPIQPVGARNIMVRMLVSLLIRIRANGGP